MDCEDSIAAVDAEDKIVVYRNWLGLMKGDLTESFEKAGKTITRKAQRRPSPIRHRTAAELILHCRSLMLVRNVGHLMTNPAILDPRRQRNPGRHARCLCHRPHRAAMTSARMAAARTRRTGSMYVVKPKMHGPEEVAFAAEIFGARRGCARHAPQHHQDGHHGRGAPHDGQPQGGDPRGPRANESCSSTPASSIAPATKSTLRWKRAR
jgi:malate synthase